MNAAPLLLITGASRGIGAATARLAAAQGWDVAINYTTNEADAEAVADAVRAAGRRALTLCADVADEGQVRAMFTTLDRHAADGGGVLAGLVNNAGVVDQAARLDEMSGSRLERMFAILDTLAAQPDATAGLAPPPPAAFAQILGRLRGPGNDAR